jgi:hypothetical protein
MLGSHFPVIEYIITYSLVGDKMEIGMDDRSCNQNSLEINVAKPNCGPKSS